jgi:hypothetical protein
MVQFNIPNCFSGDCDCEGSPPPSSFCPYGDCLSCTPSECEGAKCCCCASIDVVFAIRSRCYDRVYFSCNSDGTSPGPGEVPFPEDCTICFDACNRALGGSEACTSISQYTANPSFQPSPPDWWGFPPSIGPCTCKCLEYVDPNVPDLGCNLTCVTCSGLKCSADVEVIASSCSYQFNLTPGSQCCGTPAFVDAVFVIDFSNSMSVPINSVIGNVEILVDNLVATGAFARLGLIVYGKTRENDITINRFGDNNEILTSDVEEFKAKVSSNLPTTGGHEPDFDAVEMALLTYPWQGVENIIFLIGNEKIDNSGKTPISGGIGDPDGQPTAALLIDLANELGVTIHTLQPEPGDSQYAPEKTDLATGTNGRNLDYLSSFGDIIQELNLQVFGAACSCLDFTPIPVQWCRGGVGPNGDECIDPDPNLRIKTCVEEDNSDCACNEPLYFDVCGEIIVVEPDPNTVNLVCCGEIEGGGCSCPTEAIPPEGCCGLICSDINICVDFQNMEDAIDAVWCECWQKARDGEFVLETPGCTRCTIPSLNDPDYASLDIDAITNCTIKIPNGLGGFITRSRSEVAAEVAILWANCLKSDEPLPPSIDSSAGVCLPKCDRTDECITPNLLCSDSEDIRTCRQNACSTTNSGCSSIKNTASVILNNGIGLVAYESIEDISVIKIQQFNTSLPAKILPNRKTNYGRLENELNWTLDEVNSIKIAKLYYYEDISSHFMNGVAAIPAPNTLTDLIFFKNGPLQNQCFSLNATPIDSDDNGDYIQFNVKLDYELSNIFSSLDDVYNIEWFIIDGDDTGLTGSAIANAETPGDQFLNDVNSVNKVLNLPAHVYNSRPVPVAFPSLACAYNYMNSVENSHFVYLAYQAMEDKRWNVYLRQIRLSEYSRETQLDPVNATFISLSEAQITELVYRIVCVNDSCEVFGNRFLIKRTITLEIVLRDGRPVFNKDLMESSESWDICQGLTGDFSKKRVFATFAHSAVTNRCPTEFEFDDIFYNWIVGDEYAVPFISLSANQLFVLLRKNNESTIDIGEESVQVGNITVYSSQVGAIWFDDPTVNTWITTDATTLEDLLRFKGNDVSDPILLSHHQEGHCTHPVVAVDLNNDVYVVYQHTDPLLSQIYITGTAIPTSSLPLGISIPKNMDANLDYFLAPNDFVYNSSITNTGLNQLPDMFVDSNNVVHVCWQSNRDGYWEIYYANSESSFVHIRVTNFKSKSLKPKIAGDNYGNIYIVWHDNRFGNWEIFLAYLDDKRTETVYEQDPYLATSRNAGYVYSADSVPLTLHNSSYSETLCISNLLVRFYKDRLLDLAEFDVAQSQFPMAFTIPNAQDDRTTSTWSDPVTEWELISAGDNDIYGPILRSIDTGLTGSFFEIIQLSFTTQPQFIRFISSSYVDENEELVALKEEAISLGEDPDTVSLADTAWRTELDSTSNWIQADHLISGDTYNIEDLARDYAVGTVTLTNGRYKRVEVKLVSAASFDMTSVSIVSVIKSRLCIAPRDTVTAYLDLTPSIRQDSLGNLTVETPLPVKAKKNGVYFINVLATDDNNQLRVFGDQRRSVSCETCSNSSSSAALSCSVTVILQNFSPDDQTTKYFNARVRFYADQEKQDLIAQFDAFQNGDLQYFSCDNNNPAQDEWTSAGLEVFHNQSRTLILWPTLSNDDLICGITYWVETEVCSGVSGEPCSRVNLASTSFISWVCDCSSPRWSNYDESPQNIRNLIRWHSSGNGYQDTRLTETNATNLNPQIRIRSDRTGIVIFETDRESTPTGLNQYSIYASAFSILPSYNMYASGAESINTSFNDIFIRYDVPVSKCAIGTGNCTENGSAISGRNPFFVLDQYDNLFLTVEVPNDQAQCEAFSLNKQQKALVHRCGVAAKNLIFAEIIEQQTATETCDSKEILEKTSIFQNQVFKQTIRAIRVVKKFAQYFITRSNRVSPVVNQCKIKLDIVCEPDVVAIRLRNEDGDWSVWYPFNRQVGDYTLQLPWNLSSTSGVKVVTAQAATYQGLSSTFSLTIIADYQGVTHSVKFYRSQTTPTPEETTSNADLLLLLEGSSAVFATANELALLGGVPVTAIRHPSVIEGSIDLKSGEFIFIEIFPEHSYIDLLGIDNLQPAQQNTLAPSFDILQQGSEDLFNLPTIYNAVTKTFRGVFPIKRDNKTLHRDGLSYLIPHFKLDCSTIGGVAGHLNYAKDKFNEIGSVPMSVNSTETIFDRDRVGNIQYPIDIRSDDPYFIFGDPNYVEP